MHFLSLGVKGLIKTSRDLGSHQYRNGAWDHLEGQDSSKDKQKCCGSTIAMWPGCTNSHYCSGVAYLLGIFACSVPPNDPKCLCVAGSDPVSHSFW